MKRLFASCFGLGYLPVAPGTWGSLPPAVMFGFLYVLGASAMVVSAVMSAMFVAGSVGCLICAPSVVIKTGGSDPSEVVADEFAGQALALAGVPFFISDGVSTGHIFGVSLSCFILFRLFDIVKPWPIRRLEKLSGAWGILADDLLAAVYAAALFLICYNFVS